MSKATKPAAENAATKRKLTRAEKREIEAIIRKYKGDGKPHTAQDTIPYQTMHPDGICYLGGRSYSKSIEFFDVNYQLAQPDDQTAIFEYLCDLYNYLDASIHVQLSRTDRTHNCPAQEKRARRGQVFFSRSRSAANPKYQQAQRKRQHNRRNDFARPG